MGLRCLARGPVRTTSGETPELFASAHGMERFFAPSIKGTADIDWDDAEAREAFLTGLIADGERCLKLAREARSQLEAGSPEDERIKPATELLTQLPWQDVEPTEWGYAVKQGTAKDRVPSVEDPEQRHGHKSHGRSFTGHKGGIVVDPGRFFEIEYPLPAELTQGKERVTVRL